MADLPRSPSLSTRLVRVLCRALLALVGWRAMELHPPPPKAVIVAAPHTSNWDGVLMLLAAGALGIRMRWALKAEATRGPIGWLLLRLGALPLRRDGNLGTVEQLTAAFEERDELLLAIAPAGTRSLTEHWRSGFYHLARAARVPMLLGVVDYGARRAGTGPLVRVSDDVGADMDAIRAFYSTTRARFPERTTPARLRDEPNTADEKPAEPPEH